LYARCLRKNAQRHACVDTGLILKRTGMRGAARTHGLGEDSRTVKMQRKRGGVLPLTALGSYILSKPMERVTIPPP